MLEGATAAAQAEVASLETPVTHHPVQPDEGAQTMRTPARRRWIPSSGSRIDPQLAPTPGAPSDRDRDPRALGAQPAPASDERPWRPRPGLTDQLAAGALLHALEPDWTPGAAAAALALRADGDQFALRRALARIQLRSLERTTPVAERAASALRLALDSSPTTPVTGER
jgi:hypothetical protein